MKYLFLIYLLIIAISANAQFNDSISHYVYLGSSGTFNRTNDGNSFVLSNTGKYTLDKKKITFHSINTYIYGQQQGNIINNDFSAVIDFDYLKKQQKFYYWGLATYDKSYSLKINNRFQVGTGIGYNLVRKPNASVVISDGIIFERSDLTDGSLAEFNYSVWRNSFRIKYRWVFHSIFVLDGSGFLQPSLSSNHDNIIKSTTTLSVKIKKWLSLTTSVTYNKITRTERENLLMTYGLVMERYF